MTPIVKSNGAEIPAIGLGTWDARGDAVVRAVTAALDAGYRHIDTAAMYGNETEVGEAIRNHATPRERDLRHHEGLVRASSRMAGCRNRRKRV